MCVCVCVYVCKCVKKPTRICFVAWDCEDFPMEIFNSSVINLPLLKFKRF